MVVVAVVKLMTMFVRFSSLSCLAAGLPKFHWQWNVCSSMPSTICI